MPKRRAALSPEQEAAIDAGRRHFAWYMFWAHRTDMADVAGGQAEPAAHHAVIIEALMNESLGHLNIVAPRGSAKTTLITAWLEWKLGCASLEGGDWAQNFRIVYVTSAASLAYRVSNAIKATIEENDWFHLMFPDVKPHRDKWSEPEWKVKGNNSLHSNFIGTGAKGTILGARALVIVTDDIIGEEEANSATERERILGTPDYRKGWIDTTVAPMMIPWGRHINICTRWHENDAHTWAEEQGWHTIYMKALEECDGGDGRDGTGCVRDSGGSRDTPQRGLGTSAGVGRGEVVSVAAASSDAAQVGCRGHSYWPERFPTKQLLAMQKAKPLAFALSYQNEIHPSEGLLFKREWFRNRFDWAPSPEEVRHVFGTWDTAGTLTGRSYTVGLVVAVTREWDYHILHMVRGKLEYPDLKRVIRQTAQRWKVSASVIEAKSTGQPALQELKREGLRVEPVLPVGQRGGPAQIDWVQTITIPCEEGRIWLPSHEFLRKHNVDDWTETFLGEVLAFPEGPNDDIVVALTQLLYHLERNRERWNFEESYAQLGPMRWGDPEELGMRPWQRRQLERRSALSRGEPKVMV